MQNSFVSGSADAVGIGSWHTLSLPTVGTSASGSLDGKPLFSGTTIRGLDTGFAALGMNNWFGVEFDDFEIKQAGPHWSPPVSPCTQAQVGDILSARNCSTNGLPVADQEWELKSTWQLKHIPSGLCAEVIGQQVKLAKCKSITSEEGMPQQFKNDYTRIRNAVEPISIGGTWSGMKLAGNTAGKVSVQENPKKDGGSWATWAYFPNTNQLRNQYVADEALGYPMCLSTCS